MDGGSANRKAFIYTEQHNGEKLGYISMPGKVFEPVIPVFESSKTYAS